MREDLPLITVIITTYNRVNLLEKALLSVIRQTYKNLEIIISDNHSEDGTEELCKKYAKTDSRIRYFRQEKNLGMPANTNFAHSKSNGEYTHVLCDDDWLDEDFIEKSYEEIRKNPEYNYIYPTVKLYDGDNNFISEDNIHKTWREEFPDGHLGITHPEYERNGDVYFDILCSYAK